MYRRLTNVVVFVIMAACAMSAANLTYYVATEGDDSWSGRFAKGEAEAEVADGPFRTLSRARDAVRQARAAGEAGPVDILIHGGEYRLSETLELTPKDSGTEQGPVTWRAFAGGDVCVSGVVPVTGWQRWRGGIFRAPLPPVSEEGWYFRHLFWGGKPQPRAQYPNVAPEKSRYEGWLFLEKPEKKGSKTSFYCLPGTLKDWAHPQHAEIDIFPWHGWNNSVIRVKEVDLDRSLVRLSRKTSYNITSGNRFRFFNLLEELDQPGEWYLDLDQRFLYFWPPKSLLSKLFSRDDVAGEITVPLTKILIHFAGAPATGTAVEHVRFEGITFKGNLSGPGIKCDTIRHCEFRNCRFVDLAATGIEFTNANSENTVTRCRLSDLGGSGITIFPGKHGHCTNNRFTYNHCHHLGRINRHVAAVYGGTSNGNLIAHNLIHHMPRYAISFKHGFGRNTIEYNEIRWTNLETNDTGAVESWQWKPELSDTYTKGNIYRYNLITDVIGCKSFSGGVFKVPTYTWGIYLDDYSSRNEIVGNVIVRNILGGICLHGGADNLCRHNILVDSRDVQFCYNNIKGYMRGNRTLENVFYFSNPAAALFNLGGYTDVQVAESDRNLFWFDGADLRIRGLPGIPAEKGWKAWRGKGFDEHSLIADPRFVNPRKDDYRLRPGSPAFALGFKAPDLSRVGLRGTDMWTSQVRRLALRGIPLPKPPKRSAQAVPTGLHPVKPVARSFEAPEPAVIDGAVGASEWPLFATGDTLYIHELSNYGGPGTSPSSAAVMHDDDTLYVALKVPVANAADLPPKSEERWGRDDAAEVCLRVIPSRGKPGQIFVLRGYTSGKLESSTEAGAPPELALRLGERTRYAASVAKDHWAAEYAIPWEAMGVPLKRIHHLEFNIGIRKTAVREWGVWVGTSSQNWRVQEAGHLVFLPPVPAGGPQLFPHPELNTASAGTQLPEGWSMTRWGTSEEPDVKEREPKLDYLAEGTWGSNCFRMHSANKEKMATRQGGFAHTFRNPEPGNYLFSFRMKAEQLVSVRKKGTFCAFVHLLRKNGSHGPNLGGDETASRAGSMPWTRREVLVNVPPDTGSITVTFIFGGMLGTVWVDDISLHRVP